VSLGSRQRGVTLIEVLCAFVVLTIGATVAFESILNSVTQINRMRFAQTAHISRAVVLDRIRGINPHVQPSGELQLDGRTVRWTSEMIETNKNEAGSSDAVPRQVSLYRVKFAVSSNDATVSDDFELSLAGYEEKPPGSGLQMFGLSP
jgi:prepilin-type N-terminal cleavage/methylation domain-containing protein